MPITFGGSRDILAVTSDRPEIVLAVSRAECEAQLVPSEPKPSAIIYHLALRNEWLEASEAGTEYRRSTLGASVDDVGFIHCSFANQVQRTADLFYRGRSDVVLLVIDPSHLEAELRVENLDGGEDEFPHIYAPLPIGAVIRVEPVGVDGDGTLDVARLVDEA